MLDITSRIIFFLVLIPAVVFHEVAHGFMANYLGDPTAKNAGRLSLNPIKHIDPIGTILIPAVLIISGFPLVFGYAKPVPIDPTKFRNFRTGLFFTGFSGPAVNLVFATVSGAALLLLGGLPSRLVGSLGPVRLTSPLDALLLVLFLFYEINLVLLFINIIPIPPLDGSRIWPLVLSDQGMVAYAQLEQYGLFIVLAFILLFGQPFFAATVDPLLRMVIHP